MLTFDYAFLFFPGFTKCKRADKMVTPEMKQPSHVTFFFLQCYCTGTVPPDMEIRFSKQGLNIKCINCVVINSESDSVITEGRLLQEK